MRRILSIGLFSSVIVAGCSSSGSSAPHPSVTIGDAPYTLTIAPDTKTLTLSRGGDVLLSFPADGFELGTVDALDDGQSYDPYWIEYAPGGGTPDPPADLSWRTVTAATVSSSARDGASVALAFGDLAATLVVHADAVGRFSATLTPTLAANRQEVAYVRLRARATTSEGFYGLGELEDTVEQRGQLRPMQIEADGSLESSYNEAHVPIPLLIGTRGWGIFVESRRVGLFDVARKEPDVVEITYGTADESASGFRFHLLAADHPLDITKRYYDITGYPRLPAQWALGPWMWRNATRDEAQFLDDVKKIRDLDLAATGIWIDNPWQTAVDTFDFDPAKFSDPQAMIQAAHDAGLRFALWSTPYLEKATGALRAEADSKGYFPPASGIPFNPWSDPIDFSNRDAYAFWQSLISKLTTMGVEGFKLDYGEDIVPSLLHGRLKWTFADGSTERTMHYDYTRLFHRAYAEKLPTDAYLLCRAGRWGDQTNVSVIWPGDMDATFTKHGETFTGSDGKPIVGVGGLPATIVMGLSLGPSGFPFFASDTAGYRHSPGDKELWMRWMEQTALSTVMNVGDSSSQMPWEFTADNGRDQEALDAYRTYARLHVRLFPYEWTYAQRIATDGRPITRALGLAYPDLGVHPSDTYLFGDDLLVAPVIVRGAMSRRVTLPPGAWLDWWDGTVYTGGADVDVPAPLGKLPLLLREGAIVPLLRPTIDTIAPATAANVDSFANDPGALFVRIVPRADGASTSFTLYDGASIDASARAITTKSGSVFAAGATLEVLRVAAKPSGVARNGAAMTEVADTPALAAAADGWTWDAAASGGTLWIKVPGGEQHVAVQ